MTIMDQANAVLAGNREGMILGIIITIKYYEPTINNTEIKKRIKDILPEWNKEKLDYWFDWFNLNI